MIDIIYDKASDVDHDNGEVLVSGPAGVAVSMTPEAAVITGGRLLEHAAAASGERAIEAKRDRGDERDQVDECDRLKGNT